jgi:hypothetical protein
MCAFMYVYMPLRLMEDGGLFLYVTEVQAEFYQSIALASIAALVLGAFGGSSVTPGSDWEQPSYDAKKLRRHGYLLGTIGLLAWTYTIQNAGGVANVFSRAKGMGWSDYGYVREAAYLMIVGLLLLLSAEAYDSRNWGWRLAVSLFAIPYLLQGLLGAQRGPTFLATVTVGMSWYLGRRRRPPLVLVAMGGSTLLFLMLFLVQNRSRIYLGSDEDLKTDVSDFFVPNEANEYIFGAGCMTTANQTRHFFWGRRYLAQLLVRPIPRQIWLNKYVDFGVPEIEQNAGVAGPGLEAVMGWQEVPGAAAGMVADVWVEFSWLTIPFLALVGWGLGAVWRRALWIGGPWVTVFTVCMLLSVYFVSQSGEAVIFRFVILALPSYLAWSHARLATQAIPMAATA